MNIAGQGERRVIKVNHARSERTKKKHVKKKAMKRRNGGTEN